MTEELIKIKEEAVSKLLEILPEENRNDLINALECEHALTKRGGNNE